MDSEERNIIFEQITLAFYMKEKNWLFPGPLEANLCIFGTRGYSLKVEKCVQGFPNLVRVLRLSQYLTCT
jgi:hypothetical protein